MILTDEEKVAFKAGSLDLWVENPQDGMEYRVADLDDTDHFIAQRYSAVEDRFVDIDGQLGDFPAALPLDPVPGSGTIETNP